MAWSCIRGGLVWLLEKGFSPRKWLEPGTGSAREVATALRLTEFKQHLHNSQKPGVILGDGASQDQELDSVIPVASFQLSISCDCDTCAHICRGRNKNFSYKGAHSDRCVCLRIIEHVKGFCFTTFLYFALSKGKYLHCTYLCICLSIYCFTHSLYILKLAANQNPIKKINQYFPSTG